METAGTRSLKIAAVFSLFFFALLGVSFAVADFDGAGWLARWYPAALGLTLTMECGYAFAVGYRKKREVVSVAMCSLLTHPLLHVAVILLSERSGAYDVGMAWIILFELLIVAAEACLLNAFLPERPRRRNALLSLEMNAFSFVVGSALVSAVMGLVG